MSFLAVCGEPGCAELITSGRRYCPVHGRERDAQIKARSSWRWVYDDPRWSALKRRVRAEQPWCDEPGCHELGTEVDHRVPLQDGGAPFDRDNVHNMCRQHHSRKTAAELRDRRDIE